MELKKIQEKNRPLFSLLRQLRLPLGQYVIVGSGPLGIRGLREIQDIDLIVNDTLWAVLVKKYGEKDKRIVFPEGNIEAFLENSSELSRGNRIQEAEMIEGLPFDALSHVQSFKKTRAHPKDIKDLLALQTFIPSLQKYQDSVLYAAYLATPLGDMVAIGDDKALYLLEFADKKGLWQEIERLEKRTNASTLLKDSSPIHSIRLELDQYFQKKLKTFTTPLCQIGTPFQIKVWQELQKIPFSKTLSYAELAIAIGRPTACRAVARANSTNPLAIIVPCHRVIETSGKLGGYAGGISRKESLLKLESLSL